MKKSIHPIMWQKNNNKYVIFFFGDNMKVKIFDEEDERYLEKDINEFLKEHKDIIDIKYQVSISIFSEEQIYCFSALIMYK